jgi:hypothetical protein
MSDPGHVETEAAEEATEQTAADLEERGHQPRPNGAKL